MIANALDALRCLTFVAKFFRLAMVFKCQLKGQDVKGLGELV